MTLRPTVPSVTGSKSPGTVGIPGGQFIARDLVIACHQPPSEHGPSPYLGYVFVTQRVTDVEAVSTRLRSRAASRN